MDKEGVVEVRIISAPETTESTQTLRALLGPAEILEVIRNRDPLRSPVEMGRLFGLDHDEEGLRIQEELSELKQANVEFELLVEGEVESEEVLRNIYERFIQIGEDLK